MSLTLVEAATAPEAAEWRGGRVVATAAGFADATGWELKPEGLCRGPACVPVTGTGIVDAGGDDSIDVTAFAERLGLALVVDEARGVAALAGDPMAKGQTTNLAEVTLPDVDGNDVAFADLVGRKTLLVAWASW